MDKKEEYFEGIDTQEDKDWDELKSLFVGKDRVQIDKISEFLENPEALIQKIAKILPQAVQLIQDKNQDLTNDLTKAFQPIIEKAIKASAIADPQALSEGLHVVLPSTINLSREKSKELTNLLAESLTPLVEKAVWNSTQINIKPLSEGLYPIIGPAIRKAVRAAFKKMNQNLNRNLNKTLSISAVKWRIQSLTTGQPFIDIVSQNTLAYQVTQIFLIHRETGLLLLDVESPNITSRDADMVSAMLKAIQDFVQDSFSIEKKETLSTIEVGENTIWIEQGPKAILAAVVYGNAPLTLRDRFIKALEQIHLDHFNQLSDFDGDTEPFESNPQILEYCLQQQEKKEEQKPSKAKWIILAVILVTVSYFGYTYFQSQNQWTNYIDKIESLPGIIVIKDGKKDHQFYVKGLRTSESQDPEKILESFKIDPLEVNSDWRFFHFISSDYVLKRALQTLSPPESVQISINGTVLSLKGIVEENWLEQTKETIKTIWEITEINIDHLKTIASNSVKKVQINKPKDYTKEIDTYKTSIESKVFYFPIAGTGLSEDQVDQLSDIAASLKQLIYYAQLSNINLKLQIKGYADSVGKRELNEKFGKLRAKSIFDQLDKNGINQSIMSTQAFIEKITGNTSDQLKRRVILEVLLIKN
jgi:outer membrane protein OmpA-like peptidoglycan-associated protein